MSDSHSEEAKRRLSLSLFNRYWEQAVEADITADMTATMAISASLYALVAKHGIDETLEFVEDLKLNVQEGHFSNPKS